MNRFFNGRYGLDAYSIFLVLFSLMFLQTQYLWVIGAALAVYALYRSLSKDKAKRYVELQKFTAAYQQFINKANHVLILFKAPFIRTHRRFKERKEFIYVKCPKCKKFLRLPRNKGKLEVTCPVCRETFLKKT
jgi:ribosomal protein S27E